MIFCQIFETERFYGQIFLSAGSFAVAIINYLAKTKLLLAYEVIAINSSSLEARAV